VHSFLGFTQALRENGNAIVRTLKLWQLRTWSQMQQGCVETVLEETSYQEWEPPQVISMLERELTLFIQIWDLFHLIGRKLIQREGKCTS
jgi:hypothetical protein